MNIRSLVRVGALVAGIPLLLGLMSCSDSGTPSPPITAASILTRASVAGVPGATVSPSSGTMTVGAAAAPVVTSTSTAAPGAAVTLSVQTTAPASQILVGVQGLPGFVTINLGAARSRQSGPQTYVVTITLGAGSLPNPLVLIVETTDQLGNLSQPVTVTLPQAQGGTGSFAGQYSGNFSGTVVNNGVSTAVSGPIAMVVDSSGALTATFSPTQAGQNPAVFSGTVSQSGVVSGTSQGGGGATITLTGNLQAQGSTASGGGSVTGGNGAQVTWTVSRTSTTVPPSFAGQYSGTFNGTVISDSGVQTAASGPIAAIVDSSGAFTATFSPTQAGNNRPAVFTGSVSQSGAVSATGSGGTNSNGTTRVITLTGSLQMQGSGVTGTGSVTGQGIVQITWSISRFSTTVSRSLFAGTYAGSYSSDQMVLGTLSATVDSSGNFTATGTPQGSQSSVTFTGTVSPTGSLSATGTPPGSTSPITLSGAFELVGSTVTANGRFSQPGGDSGNFSLQPAVR